MQPESKTTRLDTWLFLIVIASLYGFYRYVEVLFWPPQAIHFIRQTDCLSFIAFYQFNGFDLFKPGTFTLFSHDGFTASEFPFAYYVMALIWEIAGRQEFILKAYNLSLYTLGMWHLYLFSKSQLGNRLFALIPVIFMSASPLVVYYANNFLPDIRALGLSFSGIYFFSCYMNQSKQTYGFWCMLFFTWSALLKVTYFIYPTACMAYLIVYNKGRLKSIIQILSAYIVATILVGVWMLIVVIYNKTHHGYFLSSATPIWSLSKDTIAKVWHMMLTYWVNWYFSSQQYIVLGISFVLVIITSVRYKQVECILPLCMLLGSVAYILLFFRQFHDHDYYMLTVFPTLAVWLVFGLRVFRIRQQFALYFVWCICVLYVGLSSTGHAKNYVGWRYWNLKENEVDMFARIGFKLADARFVLEENKIADTARFVYVSDPGVNGAGYYCNRLGWSVWDTTANRLSEIPKFVDLGADYILITDTAYASHPLVSGFLDSCVINSDSFDVYTIQHDKTHWPIFR